MCTFCTFKISLLVVNRPQTKHGKMNMFEIIAVCAILSRFTQTNGADSQVLGVGFQDCSLLYWSNWERACFHTFLDIFMRWVFVSSFFFKENSKMNIAWNILERTSPPQIAPHLWLPPLCVGVNEKSLRQLYAGMISVGGARASAFIPALKTACLGFALLWSSSRWKPPNHMQKKYCSQVHGVSVEWNLKSMP